MGWVLDFFRIKKISRLCLTDARRLVAHSKKTGIALYPVPKYYYGLTQATDPNPSFLLLSRGNLHD